MSLRHLDWRTTTPSIWGVGTLRIKMKTHSASEQILCCVDPLGTELLVFPVRNRRVARIAAISTNGLTQAGAIAFSLFIQPPSGANESPTPFWSAHLLIPASYFFYLNFAIGLSTYNVDVAPDTIYNQQIGLPSAYIDKDFDLFIRCVGYDTWPMVNIWLETPLDG